MNDDTPQVEPSVVADSVAETTPSPAPASEAPAPQADTTPQATSDNVPPATQEVASEPQLYELPDGRKVDAETLATEWKEKFMPDYTRKSQIAAQVAKQASPATTDNSTNNASQDTPYWRNPDWQPQTYAEVIEAAKAEIKYEQAREQSEKEAYRQTINTVVESQLAEIRKIEPNLSEDLLFAHATKYGFSDLGTAYKNMKDFNLAVKRTEQQVRQNIASRAEDPIAVATQQPNASDGIDYNSISNDYRSPIEMLRSLKKG